MNNTCKNRQWGAAGLILLITIVVYLPALRGGFIFDDKPLIVDNQLIQTPDGLSRIWLTTEAPDYYPLTWSFWRVQWKIGGPNATAFHAINLLLHAANVLLIWCVLCRLRIPGAWLAALLFAIHPVNVATVAWISEQKNTLSMLFFMLSILWYVRFDEQPRKYWYGLSLMAFFLALLSKSAVVMLPFVLLGCIGWLRGRVSRTDLSRMLPFFSISLVLGLTTVWFQYHRVLEGQAVGPGGPLSRLAVAGAAPWFYFFKAMLPLNLCLIYPQWTPGEWGWRGCLPGIALVSGLAVLWSQRQRWGRAWLFATGYFVVMLFPVLGFFDQGFYQHALVADHWQYYSLAGLTALAGAGIMTISGRLDAGQRLSARVATGLLVLILAWLSYQRCTIFQTEEKLFTDNLRYNPQAWGAHLNLGNALEKSGRLPEAIEHYQQVLRIKPGYAQAHNNLGIVLLKMGQPQEALGQFEQALRIKPDLAGTHNNLANALSQLGRTQEAIVHLQQAVQISPDYADARYGLGYLLLQTGRTREAVGHLEQALRIRPDYPEAHYAIGYALSQSGKTTEAIRHYEQALQNRPNFPEAHYNLGTVLLQTGQPREAIEHFEQALRLKPDFAAARSALERAQEQAGDPRLPLVPPSVNR